MDDLEDRDGGELIEMPEAIDDVEDTDDGGAIVHMGDDTAPEDSDFYANLAEDIPDSELSKLALSLLELLDKDRSARKRRDEQYQEGIRRTGLGDEAPGGASFEGASKIVHPMLTEACVDFAARTIKELFPPQGPAKDRIDGKQTAKKISKARRKMALMNWQLTVQVPEFRAELEQLLTQVPLGGGQYLKLRWHEKRNRPDPLFVAIDDMLLPYAATNFYTAQRKTHVQYLTELDYKQRVKSGMYRDVDLLPTSMEPDGTLSGESSDKIEGREQSGFNEDGLRTVFEVYAVVDVDFDDKAEDAAPYIITIDQTTHRVLSVYRNWEEEDEAQEELQWFVEFPFIPWRGAYPIGLGQMIGGLSGAATGALRALLDSAHIQNVPTMLKLKGKVGGQSASLQPGETMEIEGGLNVDDIRKIAMPMPFNQPSAVLFSLLGFIIDAAKGVVRTSLDDISENNPNAPVGTTLARIEQGLVVYSAVFGRMHDAMGRVLRILHRLNARYLDNEQLQKEAGEELATRDDFEGPLDVVPVSDPNIFSEAQRIAQTQTIAQRAAALPQLYNQRKVEERILATLKIPNPDDLLNPPVEPKMQNAVNENVAATLGRPITAFPDQDHLAHLQTHISYMLNPMFGGSPLILPQFLPITLNHLKEHIALWYAQQVFEATSEALGTDLGDLMREMQEDESSEDELRELDRMLAEASMVALKSGVETLQSLPPVIQQAQQILQQLQQAQMPQGQDPRIALEQQKLQQQGQRDQQQAQIDQQDQAFKQQKAQLDQQLDMFDRQVEQQQFDKSLAVRVGEMQQKAAEKRAEIDAKRAMNAEDNQTALTIAAAEIQSGEEVAFSTGTGINP